MSIGLCNSNILGTRIKDILKIAKAQTINSSVTSFSMICFDIIHNTEKISIYTLIPGIEEVQIIQIKKDNEEKAYVVKNMMLSEISLATLFNLLERNTKIDYWEKNDKLEELLEVINILPEELIDAYNILGKVSCYGSIDKLDIIYNNFCNNIKEMRNAKKQYLEIIQKEEIKENNKSINSHIHR